MLLSPLYSSLSVQLIVSLIYKCSVFKANRVFIRLTRNYTLLTRSKGNTHPLVLRDVYIASFIIEYIVELVVQRLVTRYYTSSTIITLTCLKNVFQATRDNVSINNRGTLASQQRNVVVRGSDSEIGDISRGQLATLEGVGVDVAQLRTYRYNDREVRVVPSYYELKVLRGEARVQYVRSRGRVEDISAVRKVQILNSKLLGLPWRQRSMFSQLNLISYRERSWSNVYRDREVLVGSYI